MGEGWRPDEPGKQSAGPPWADMDVGGLLSTLAAGLRMGTPKIDTFSSDATPGKTKMSFKQWYHKVQCVKDHYLGAVVWDSISKSLKGAVAHMAQYLGPTASVDHILQKLWIMFETVAPFDILMQNFYTVTQGNNEKAPPLLQD